MPDIYVADKKKKKKSKIKKEKILSLKEKTKNHLAAFVAHPDNLRFETQEKEEKIILLLRRHSITNVSWILISLVLFIAPAFVFEWLPLGFLPARFQLIVKLVWYLMVFAFAFERLLGWFFNVNIITDERIIDLDFPSILYKDTSETKIDQVQDVSVKVGGYGRSLLNYGDVWIQTAGSVPQICFEAVPNPERVAKILNELKLEEEQEKLEGRVR